MPVSLPRIRAGSDPEREGEMRVPEHCKDRVIARPFAVFRQDLGVLPAKAD